MLKVMVLALLLVSCDIGKIDNDYEGRQTSVYKATLDGNVVFYSAETYTCISEFMYTEPDLFPVLNTDTTPVVCEDEVYIFVSITNTTSGLIE